MILGITGKYCSGKNTVAELFVSKGWKEIDVDRLGHEALTLKSKDVISVFGSEITDDEGAIDRKKLGKIVFSSRKALRILEGILHPEMVRLCEMRIKHLSDHANVLINAAILHRMGLNKLCNAVLWVKSPFFSRLKRSFQRDKHSLIHTLKRMISQRKLDAKYYYKDVDSYIIWNTASITDLESEVVRLLAVLGERE